MSEHATSNQKVESGDFLLLAKVIIVNLDAKDYEAARRCDKVRQEERPDDFWLMKEPLQHEEQATNAHHQKGRQRNAISLARTNSFNGLWEIAQYQAQAGQDATDFIEK